MSCGIVPEPWGTRGYDDLRIRANRENLGRGVRPAVASVVDCVRMLDASDREPTPNASSRLRRMMELERELVPQPRPLHRALRPPADEPSRTGTTSLDSRRDTDAP